MEHKSSEDGSFSEVSVTSGPGAKDLISDVSLSPESLQSVYSEIND